jgi:peptide/nickel transport system ATP-binding protein/oligopeptide transport system ATP-binding protein
MHMPSLLEVEDLRAYFFLPNTTVKAVDGVDFQIQKGEIVGLAGESGCGKSVTTQCILRLLPNSGRIVGGDIRLSGQSLLSLSDEQMRQVRGDRISIVLQDALAALNPVIPTGQQVADIYKAHNKVSMKSAWGRAVEMMRKVGIPAPKTRSRQFPHEFSGGMQQRAVIATALTCGPELIIADEPTTALDVTIQMQILNLLKQAQQELGSAVLYISHDLANVARICDRVMIMYAGEIVESASTRDLYTNPLHPYTQGLLSSIPPLEGGSTEFLSAISGMPPNPAKYPPGCRFAPRCIRVQDECLAERPKLLQLGAGRKVRCVLYKDEAV